MFERALQPLAIVCAAHAEIGKVMQKLSEHLHAIRGVCPGVEDMVVPERIYGVIWNDCLPGIVADESEKLPIGSLDCVRLGRAPSLSLVRVHDLYFYRTQIEAFNRVGAIGLAP